MICFFVSTLHLDALPEKPFNPVLGETFQGIIGGCPVYFEQISHHPPVCAFQLYGRGFELSGSKEFYASIQANSVKSKGFGYPIVRFKNTGNCIMVQHPNGVMEGTSFGKRILHLENRFYFIDFANRLYCELDFSVGNDGFFKKRQFAKDFFYGKIVRVNQRFIEKLIKARNTKKEFTHKIKEKKYVVEEIAVVEGYWPSSVFIGGIQMWSYGNPWGYQLQYFDNPLPSDSNYRTDIIYLRAGDEKKSQDTKEVIEEAQRRDRKLRENYESRRKH